MSGGIAEWFWEGICFGGERNAWVLMLDTWNSTFRRIIRRSIGCVSE